MHVYACSNTSYWCTHTHTHTTLPTPSTRHTHSTSPHSHTPHPSTRLHLRDFNELEHEFKVRLNKAYKPSVKYMDLFTHPLLALFARNIAFFAGSILAVLLVLTVIQEDLLTAPNILKILTSLGKWSNMNTVPYMYVHEHVYKKVIIGGLTM